MAKKSALTELFEAGTEFLKEGTVYLRHLRESYDLSMKALEEDKKMLEKMLAPPVNQAHGNRIPINVEELFRKPPTGSDGK
jgi:hypothetical protein